LIVIKTPYLIKYPWLAAGRRLWFSACAALFLIVLCSQAIRAENTLSINMGFGPNSVQGQFQMKAVGHALTYARINHKFIQRPAERALQNVENGIDDGNVLRIAGLEQLYKNLVMIPTPVLDYEFIAFTREGLNKQITSWHDLTDLNVGIVLGWKIVEENTHHLPRVTKVQDGAKLFQLLGKKRFDVVVYEYWQGLETMRALQIENVRVAHMPLAVKPMHIYVHKHHKHLVPTIDVALQQLLTSEHYATLLRTSFSSLTQWAQKTGIDPAP